jgi:hypothetical protein
MTLPHGAPLTEIPKLAKPASTATLRAPRPGRAWVLKQAYSKPHRLVCYWKQSD